MTTEDVFTFYLIPKIKTDKTQCFTAWFNGETVNVTIYVDGEIKYEYAYFPDQNSFSEVREIRNRRGLGKDEVNYIKVWEVSDRNMKLKPGVRIDPRSMINYCFLDNTNFITTCPMTVYMTTGTHKRK